MKTARDILDFWFDEENIPKQFDEDVEFDEKIRTHFLSTWEAAKEGLLVDWRSDAKGRLAEIIVLDQFSRNLWRKDIRTYTQDKMAIVLAQELLKCADYHDLPLHYKKFALLPFMHSESIALHEWAMPHFIALEDGQTLEFEIKHLDVLKKYGRYPYQNKDFGRVSTPEEEEVLREKEGRFYK